SARAPGKAEGKLLPNGLAVHGPSGPKRKSLRGWSLSSCPRLRIVYAVSLLVDIPGNFEFRGTVDLVRSLYLPSVASGVDIPTNGKSEDQVGCMDSLSLSEQ